MRVTKNTHGEALKLAYDLLDRHAKSIPIEAWATHSNPTRLYCRVGDVSAELTIEFNENRERPYRAADRKDPQLFPKVSINCYERHLSPSQALKLSPMLSMLGGAGQMLLSHFDSEPTKGKP